MYKLLQYMAAQFAGSAAQRMSIHQCNTLTDLFYAAQEIWAKQYAKVNCVEAHHMCSTTYSI